jgi:hypothetical protein
MKIHRIVVWKRMGSRVTDYMIYSTEGCTNVYVHVYMRLYKFILLKHRHIFWALVVCFCDRIKIVCQGLFMT